MQIQDHTKKEVTFTSGILFANRRVGVNSLHEQQVIKGLVILAR